VTSYFWNKLTTQLEKSYFRKLSSEYRFGYTDIPSLEVVIYYDEQKKIISGDWKSVPTELTEALSWLENSYPYTDLKKVDTLIFETKLHQSFVRPDLYLKELEDSLKKREQIN
jgi:hypothetical protein